ncbi:MAG: hypothetical protein HQ528_04725 [Candidatus Marinimicrobia bacterium]|nr:hypothetical protein [Candidatus Neomarinimicrobiota bacterium]
MKTIKIIGVAMALLTGLLAVTGLQSKTKAPTEQLIFIYNADSGIFNAVSDYVHKIVSPATYPCSLCGITYSNLGMKTAWADYLKSLAIPSLFLHMDQLGNQPKLQNLSLPAVVLQQSGITYVLIEGPEMDSVANLDELIDLMDSRIKNKRRNLTPVESS